MEMRSLKDNLIILAALACVVWAALLLTFPMHNFDVFWHMANGRIMLEEGRILDEEVLSYTASQSSYVNHEWLAQILFELVYRLGGANALIALKVLAGLATAWLIYLCVRLTGTSRAISGVLAILAVVAGLMRYTVRPQIFSFLFLALLWYLLRRYEEKRLPVKYLFIIPPVLVVWDFLHGALFGWALFGAFVAAETLRFTFSRLRSQAGPDDTKGVIGLWAAMLISLAASLISPYGLRSYELFSKVFNKSQIFNLNSEFLPTPFGMNMFLPFWAIMAATALAMLANLRRVRLTHVFVLVPLAYAAVRFNRATAVFSLACVPVLAYYLTQMKQAYPSLRPRWIGTVATAMIAAALLVVTIQVKFLLPGYPLKFGTGLYERHYPVGPTAFLKNVPLTGNMFNMGSTGGYLAYHLYPQRKIFLYNYPFLFAEIFSKINNRSILSEYNISYAVSENNYMLGLMFKETEWVPVYWDQKYVLLVRTSGANRPIADQYRLDLYTPGVKPDKLKQYESTAHMLPELSREVAQLLRFRGDTERAAYLSNLLLRPDNPIEPATAISLIDTALSTTPESASLFYAKGMTLYLKLRDPAAARAALERTTELSPRMEPAHINLGFALIDLGEHAEAAVHFREAVSINADNPKAHYGLALSADLMKDYPTSARHWEEFLKLDPNSRFASRARARLKAARENMGR